jgi:hypothetical protein
MPVARKTGLLLALAAGAAAAEAQTIETSGNVMVV